MEKIKRRQRLLAFLQGNDGKFYYEGPIDGVDGPGTRAGAERFLRDYGFAAEATSEAAPADLWAGIKYFDPEQCRCRCGEEHAPYCDGFPVQPDRVLLEVADEIREEIGDKLIRTSVIRCKQHNIDEGGVAGSRHLLGKAMDAWTPGMTSAQLLAIAQKNPRVRYAYAVDEKVVHFDVE